MSEKSLVPVLAALLALSLLSFSILSCASPRISDQALAAYAMARDAYGRGDLEEAGTILRDVLRSARGFHQAELLLGKVAFFSGDTAEAERRFRALAGRAAFSNEAAIWLVRTQVEQGRSEEAERLLEDLLSRDGGDPRLLHLMGTIRRDRDDLEGALAFFERAAAFREELARSELELARIHHIYGQEEQALREVDRTLALLPEESALAGPVAALRDAIVKGRNP